MLHHSFIACRISLDGALLTRVSNLLIKILTDLASVVGLTPSTSSSDKSQITFPKFVSIEPVDIAINRIACKISG